MGLLETQIQQKKDHHNSLSPYNFYIRSSISRANSVIALCTFFKEMFLEKHNPQGQIKLFAELFHSLL